MYGEKNRQPGIEFVMFITIFLLDVISVVRLRTLRTRTCDDKGVGQLSRFQGGQSERNLVSSSCPRRVGMSLLDAAAGGHQTTVRIGWSRGHRRGEPPSRLLIIILPSQPYKLFLSFFYRNIFFFFHYKKQMTHRFIYHQIDLLIQSEIRITLKICCVFALVKVPDWDSIRSNQSFRKLFLNQSEKCFKFRPMQINSNETEHGLIRIEF